MSHLEPTAPNTSAAASQPPAALEPSAAEKDATTKASEPLVDPHELADGLSQETLAEAVDVPAPEPPRIHRQSVASNGISCDVRLGPSVLDRFGRDLKICTGRARRAVFLVEAAVSSELVEELSRIVIDAGFRVVHLPQNDARDAGLVEGLAPTYEVLAQEHINPGDIFVAIGGLASVSEDVFISSTWCGGMSLAAVPLGLDALICCPSRPKPLGAGQDSAAVNFRTRMAMCYSDPEICQLTRPVESTLHGRVLMVVGAACESKDAFNDLVMRSEAIAAGDVEATQTQALESARSFGRVNASSSVAVRQSLSYGEVFARALATQVPDASPSSLRGEGLRFASRLGVGAVGTPVDFVFAQDALLDRLGIGELACQVDPGALKEAIARESVRLSGKPMIAVPHDIGRVRLAAIPDEVLDEHLGAWCQARSALLSQNQG